MKQEKSSTANVGQKEEKPFNLGRNILKTFAVCVTIVMAFALPFAKEKEHSSLESNVEARIYQVVNNIEAQLIEQGGIFKKDPSKVLTEEVISLSLTSNTPRVHEVNILVNSVDDDDYTITASVPKYRDTASEDIVSVKYNSQTGTLVKDN